MNTLRTSLIEPIAIPLVPVSGIAFITALANDRVCVTYFHEVPGVDPATPIEHHVAARLLWPRMLLAGVTCQFPAMLAAAEAAVVPAQRVMRFATH